MEFEKNGKQNTNPYFTLKSNAEKEAEENELNLSCLKTRDSWFFERLLPCWSLTYSPQA